MALLTDVVRAEAHPLIGASADYDALMTLIGDAPETFPSGVCKETYVKLPRKHKLSPVIFEHQIASPRINRARRAMITNRVSWMKAPLFALRLNELFSGVALTSFFVFSLSTIPRSVWHL